MRPVFTVLCVLLLPGVAHAQGGSALTPIQRCEQNHQTCVRNCFGTSAPSCIPDCDVQRAHCIQNPSTATQPRR